MSSSLRFRFVGLLLTVLSVAHGIGNAEQQPPLAEVARREAERRKTLQPPKKVLTNRDLPKTEVPPPPPAAAATERPTLGATAAPPSVDASGDKPLPEKTEAWWRARITEPRDALRRDGILAEALQARVTALTTDFAGRIDPYQRAKLGNDLQQALAETLRLQDEMTALKAAVADIEDEARKSGVPPGWLR